MVVKGGGGGGEEEPDVSGLFLPSRGALVAEGPSPGPCLLKAPPPPKSAKLPGISTCSGLLEELAS